MRGLTASGVTVVLLCLAATATLADVKMAQATSALQVSPAEIDVSTFYRGTDVQIQAEVPECDGAALVLMSGEENVTLNRKGREIGIWLNVGQVTVEGVPEVYMLAESEPLESLCSEELRRELDLGFESLRDRAIVVGEKPLLGTEFDDFVKLKEENGTYTTDIGISLTSRGTGEKRVSAIIPVPANVPPGDYPVTLYCFKNGVMTQRLASSVTIRSVGLDHLLSTLAHKHAALYGLIAIFISMSVGLVMGVVFQSLRASRH